MKTLLEHCLDDVLPLEIKQNAKDIFLTGSRAYGTPRPDSDIDIAVLFDQQFMDQFRSEWHDDDESGSGHSDSFIFDEINLITFTCQDEFNAWKEATAELIDRKPVTRVEAVALIKKKVESLYEDCLGL